MKISRRVKEYKVEILNPPREGKKLLVLDVDYTLFGKSSKIVLHLLLPITTLFFFPFVRLFFPSNMKYLKAFLIIIESISFTVENTEVICNPKPPK